MSQWHPQTLRNWGNFPTIDGESTLPRYEDEWAPLLSENTSIGIQGQHRSYGDAGLWTKSIHTHQWNKILSFSPTESLITCQSGITFDELLQFLVPRGFFLPVTPGTKFVSLGGAIAANVHGKNHHKEGSLAQFIQSIDVRVNATTTLTCSPDNYQDLFWSTCGGMGLTGIIDQATLKLKPIPTSFIRQVQHKTTNLDETLEAFDRYQDWTYSVAWIDCLARGDQLGRSLLMCGEHAQVEELSERCKSNALKTHATPKLSIPCFAPKALLNGTTMKLFNQFYYHSQQSSKTPRIVHYEPFFYPLDKIKHWNRLYGRPGFIQYQCLLPLSQGKAALTSILQTTAKLQQGSFLAVLKRFGKEELVSPLSFPGEGYTLALDFKQSDTLKDLCLQLNDIVQNHQGKIYLAKDALTPEQTFKTMYPDWNQINQVRQKYFVANIQSLQAQRLNIIA